MINAVYASKLYKASKRKDIISAAFSDVKNAGLVTQLASYLDEEYKDLATEHKQEKPQEEPAEDQAKDTSAESEEEGGEDRGGSRPHLNVPKSLHADLGDDFDPAQNLVTVDDDDISEAPAPSDSEAPSAPQEPVEESENVYGSTNIYDSIDVIKGTLNSREDTKGVTRIQIKDNEMWIYYSDDTNLNNIMTAVIEYMNASGHTDLEFNRLARSDNAIVFVINSVKEDVKPIETVEEDKG